MAGGSVGRFGIIASSSSNRPRKIPQLTVGPELSFRPEVTVIVPSVHVRIYTRTYTHTHTCI